VGDVGFSYAMNTRLSVGGALQNLGSSLRYSNRSEAMPRSARAGVAYLFPTRRMPIGLFGDFTHAADTGENRIGAGSEVRFGPLALRAGYSAGHDDRFSVGTGVMVGNWTLDYSIGLINDLNAMHRLSLSSSFGAAPTSFPHASGVATAVAPKPVPPISKTDFSPPLGAPFKPTPIGGEDGPRHVYVTQPGDTLRSIAKREYGREDLWPIISNANSHLGIGNDLAPGTRLLIPESSQ
jgi:hypothetical protein